MYYASTPINVLITCVCVRVCVTGTLIVGKQQLQYPRTIVSNFGNLIKNDLKCDRCELQRVCHNVLTVLREKSRFIDQSFECAFVFKLFLNAFYTNKISHVDYRTYQKPAPFWTRVSTFDDALFSSYSNKPTINYYDDKAQRHYLTCLLYMLNVCDTLLYFQIIYITLQTVKQALLPL